jgi:dephospho-CoA kinase
VIGVVGLPASGKGEFSQVAGELGIPVVVMGDVVRSAAAEAGLSCDDASLGELAGRLRREKGMDIIALETVAIVGKKSAPVVLVDGIRGDAEVETFHACFPDFVLIGIQADIGARLSRMATRGRSDATLCSGDLAVRDERELSWGLGRALARADYLLENNGTLDEFRLAARMLLLRLMECA